jgi:hypothetical protein
MLRNRYNKHDWFRKSAYPKVQRNIPSVNIDLNMVKCLTRIKALACLPCASRAQWNSECKEISDLQSRKQLSTDATAIPMKESKLFLFKDGEKVFSLKHSLNPRYFH